MAPFYGSDATGFPPRAVGPAVPVTAHPVGPTRSLRSGKLSAMGESNHGDQGLLYWLVKHVSVGPTIRLINRPTVEGLENIPVDGPALLAGNHLSIADWLFVPLVVPPSVIFAVS